MKCEFEHNGGCCNSESPQFMFRCKPDVCHSAAPIISADHIRPMSDDELAEMRLIDANKFEAFQVEPPKGYSDEQLEAYAAGATLVLEKIDASPTIDPGSLPVVRELQEQLAKVTAERDAAVEALSLRPHKSTCKHGDHCDFVSAITGVPNCSRCDEWEWCGPNAEI